MQCGATAAVPNNSVPGPAGSEAREQTSLVGGVVWLEDLAGASAAGGGGARYLLLSALAKPDTELQTALVAARPRGGMWAGGGKQLAHAQALAALAPLERHDPIWVANAAAPGGSAHVQEG